MSQAQARAHIERYALSPRHRVVAIAALESAPYDERDGVQWLILANNIVKALDELEDVEPGSGDATAVWTATRRTGLDFHQLATVGGESDRRITRCGRSTASPTSVFMPRYSAEDSGMKPCPRCYGGES